MSEDRRRFAPSAERNRDPILATLSPHLPISGTVLEVASGTGEHVAHFAPTHPSLIWQPTDPDADCRASIDAWAEGRTNVQPAQPLDAVANEWPILHADVVLCINMIHIAPWSATVGLVAGATRILPPGGLLVLYGPFRCAGHPLALGNVAFDADLRARDPSWGLRLLEDVVTLATGFADPSVIPMPANNLMLLFRRASPESISAA